jgi:hypothetical protein
VAHRKKNGHRRRDQSEEDGHHRPERQVESNAVIEQTLVLQRFNGLLVSAGLQTAHAQVAAAEFHQTQRTQQATASIASGRGLFTGMIKAFGLAVDGVGFRYRTLVGGPAKSVEDIRPDRITASGARMQISRVDIGNRLDGAAFWTSYHNTSRSNYL